MSAADDKNLWSPVLDPCAVDLVRQAAAAPDTDTLLALIGHLHSRCADPLVAARYARITAQAPLTDGYPLDADGYAVPFDPVEDEEGFWNCWQSRGIVVGRSVAGQATLEATVTRMEAVLTELGGPGLKVSDPSTWHLMPVDDEGVPFASRGFFELYHDAVLAELRQSLRVYLHHVVIWGRADLWISFDRLGLKLPGHTEAAALPLHVDQNPRVHPGFRTVQGVLALADCPAERGTFVGASGSRALFGAYTAVAPERGEYVELPDSYQLRASVNPQPVPLRAGDLVSWDSRTTHANSANVSDTPRWVAYIAAGPAAEDDPAAVAARAEAFLTGIGSNVRDALMHASKKPRYAAPAALAALRQPERLTALGRRLYGLERYRSGNTPA